MVTVNKSYSKGGGGSTDKHILFSPGEIPERRPTVIITDKPLHIFGTLPEGHTVSVYRVYDGDAGCVDIAPIPVMCKDGCSPLMLFNVPNPDCGNGRFIQDDIWLFYQGRYELVYFNADGEEVIPDGVYVWSMDDSLVPRLGINLPLCGENACPPECVPEHVMKLEGDVAPTSEPECLRCETPVAFHSDSEKPCELSLYFWSKAPLSKCDDEGVWERINFAEWLDSLGGLITAFEVSGDDSISAQGSIEEYEDDNGCVGRKLILSMSLGCPPATEDNIVKTIDGLYQTTLPVWVCEPDEEGNGVPRIASVVFNCPDESGTLQFATENGQLRSNKPVWTCDADGNPIRSDLIIQCPDESGIVTVKAEGTSLRSDKAVWTCDGSGNPVLSDIVIECPSTTSDITIPTNGSATSQQVWVCENGVPRLAKLKYQHPDVTSTDKTVVVNGHDVSVPCPPKAANIEFDEQGDGSLLSDDWVWVCDSSAKNGRSRKRIAIPKVDECGCCDEAGYLDGIAYGGGVCLRIKSGSGDSIYRARDNMVISGPAVPLSARPTDAHYITMPLTNPSADCPALVEMDVQAFGHQVYEASQGLPGVADIIYMYVVSENLNEPVPDTSDFLAYSSGGGGFSNDRAIATNNCFSGQVDLDNAANNSLNSTSMSLRIPLAPGQTRTFYAQFFAFIGNVRVQGDLYMHGTQHARWSIHKGAYAL